MRNLKKVLGLVLCLAMMLSIMVVGVGAAFDDQDKIDSKHQEAVNMCVSLKIIEGKDNNLFDPLGDVKRSEMTKMIAVALNGGKVPTLGTSDNPIFVDVPSTHWAQPFVENAYVQGIVSGVGDNKFDPDGQVTGSQAAKMLLVALGYNAEVENFEGPNWDVYVNQKAGEEKLYENLEDIDVNAPLSREHAAEMIWNALQALTIKKESSVDRTTGGIIDTYTKDDQDMLKKYYGINTDKGLLTDWDYNSDKSEWTFTVGGSDYKTTTDYTDLFMQNVKVVWNKNKAGDVEVYGIFAKDSTVLAEGQMGDFDLDKLADKKIKVGDDSYKATGTSLAIYAFGNDAAANVKYGTDFCGDNATKYDAYDMRLIDNDGDDKADVIVFFPFEVASVTYVGSSNINTNSKVCASLKVDETDVYDGVAKDDYVKITLADNTANRNNLIEKVDAINGKITKVTGDSRTVDSADKYTTLVTAELGNEYDLAIVNDYIFIADLTGSKITASDYAVIIKADQNGATGLNTNPQARLLLSDGKEAVVDISDDSITEPGALVTFKIDDDNVYTLKAATTDTNTSSADYCGFKVASASGAYKYSTVNKVGTIDSNKIDDNAIVFFNNTEKGTYKVITGSDLKVANQVASVINYYGSNNSSSGAKTIELAYVANKGDVASDSDTMYGYLLAKPAKVQDKDDKVVYELSVWTKDGEQTLTTKSGSAANDAAAALFSAGTKGIAVSYKLSDDLVSSLTPISDIGAIITNEKDNMVFAIGNLDATKGTVDNSDTATYYIDDDTVILTVDNSKSTLAGVQGDTTQLAIEADESGNVFFANVIFLADTKKDADGNYPLLLVVVEVNNDWYAKNK